jgi:hypothetical protein
MSERLLLDEHILADGRLRRRWAELAGVGLRVTDDEGAGGELSVGAVERVMVRYGRPLDDAIRLDGEGLDLGGGRRLRRLRYHAPVDAIARDYLVWERPGGPPLAVIAGHATAALHYLALRVDQERSQETEG